MAVVGLGMMGAGLASAWTMAGYEVVTTVSGRSDRTRARASEGGVTLLPSLGDVVATSHAFVSICPPRSASSLAMEVQQAVRDVGRQGLMYIDANAISSEHARRIADLFDGLSVHVVDAAIVGPPPRPETQTLLYLAGKSVTATEGLRARGLSVVVVGEEIGRASAVKMCIGSVYKGYLALLSRALCAAERYGVLDHVLIGLDREFPRQFETLSSRLAHATSNAARFAEEMRFAEEFGVTLGFGPELFRALEREWIALTVSDDLKQSLDRVADRHRYLAARAELPTVRMPR